MDDRDSSVDFETHSSRNVFRRHLKEQDLRRFENDALTVLSALESHQKGIDGREYSFSTKEEDAMESLFFPHQIVAKMSQGHWSHEANSESYLHMMIPRVTAQMLFSHAHVRRVRAGAILNLQNQTGTPLLVLLSGQCQGYFSEVGVESILPEGLQPADFERTFGKEQCILDAGDIFGCEMFCHRLSSSMTLIAKSNVVALRVDEKVLSVLVQQWKRIGHFAMPACRQLIKINSPDATRMITDILQMQCTLGISGLFAKKRKISLKQDLSGCMLATIPDGVDVVKFLGESFRSSVHDFLPLKVQDCDISSLDEVGAFVVLSGSFAAINRRSFQTPYNLYAKTFTCLSILGPASIIELNDPFFKNKSSSDNELLVISREPSDVLLIPQRQIILMAFQSWFSNSDSFDLEKCTAVARRVIAIDASGKHAKTSSTCTVGDIVSLCSSEARKSFLETTEPDLMMNIMIHQQCSGIIENVLKSQLSSLLVVHSDHIKALSACALLMIRMPVAVHQSHRKKVFHTAIPDSEQQSCCIIVLRGSCVAHSTSTANACGMENVFAAEMFNSMLNVPSDEVPKKLECQDICFVKKLSSLQLLSEDFLAMNLQICDIDSWADDFMSTWVLAKKALIVPCPNSLDHFYSRKERILTDGTYAKKDVIPNDDKVKSHQRDKPKKSFATSTHSSKMKRSVTTHSEYFDDLKSKNEKSCRLRLRRSLRKSESFEATLKQIIDDETVMLEHWKQIDVNSSEKVSLSELQNWLTMRFSEHFKTPKVILLSFRETLKHFRIISQGCIEMQHFSFFIGTLIDFIPAELVFDELDVNNDRKFSLSEFTMGMKKIGLEMHNIEMGSDFQDVIDASGTDATFERFCKWFLRRNLKQVLSHQDKRATSSQSNSHDSSQTSIPTSSRISQELLPIEDLEIEMCTILHLHPQLKLIPDRIALDLPYELFKVPKGAMVLPGTFLSAPRHIVFVIEGIIAALTPDSSCNPICLSAGSSIHQTISSPWHRRRIARMFYGGSTSIGDSNFFYGVGDGLDYMAVTDVVIMTLRWQVVELQWQQTMLMDLHSQHHASEYFLWSQPSTLRTNFQQMKLISSILNRKCETTMDKAVLAILCCHSQLCNTTPIAIENDQHTAVESPEVSAQSYLPLDSTADTYPLDSSARDDGILSVNFQVQGSENSALGVDSPELALNSFGAASKFSRSAIAFIVTGPAYISIKGAGLTVITESKQTVDEGISRRHTTVDVRRDSKKIKTWHILAGQCAIVASEQLASVCRGRINMSREKNTLSMSCQVDKRNLFQYPVLSAYFASASSGSVAAIDSEVQVALIDLCCTHFFQHIANCYSNHKCFSSNSIASLAASHAGTRTIKCSMGETIWKVGLEGVFVVLQGLLRVMFSFGELQLVPDSRKSGLSVSNHFVEMLCLGQMSIFGDIGSTVSSDIDGHVFVDCADAECELLFFPPSAISCLSPQCQTELKSLFQSRSHILKQSMLTQKDILHSAGFQKERMHIMHVAESESKKVHFMRDPNKYSTTQFGNDAPNSMAEISALRHFASSKNSLIKNGCFQSLNENVKECSANMASFYKQAGRQSKGDDTMDNEVRKFEENMSTLNILPLNSAAKLKRLLKKERNLESPFRSISDDPLSIEIKIDTPVLPVVHVKHISDVQMRINAKITKLKSDDNVMEAFQKRVSSFLASMPKMGELARKNKDVSSYATPEAKALRLQANSTMMKQRCEQARRNATLLESSFKESTAQKLEEDRIRIQNNLLIAENRLRQKNLADFQMETMPIFAMLSRFSWFVKVLLYEVPKAHHASQCIVFIQRWVKSIQKRKKSERRNRIYKTFRRAFRRFKMMHCLWRGTFALKLLIKFMREMKKARQVTFVIRSYM
jgi:hypothetical protein